jgi:hypothetical protein
MRVIAAQIALPARQLLDALTQEYFMYEKRLVAFLDILGFTKAVKDSEENLGKRTEIYEFIKSYSDSNHIDQCFANFYNGNGTPCNTEERKTLREIYKYSFTQFSDSFVFSVRASDRASVGFFPLLIAEFIKKAFYTGFLIRGGVSVGDMIHEENGPAFGPAFIHAYELESRQAVFGRVVVSDEAFQFLTGSSHGMLGFIDTGYDQVKEITIASFINEYFQNSGDRRIAEIENAIEHLEALKQRIPEGDKEACLPKYNYVKARLDEALEQCKSQS